MNYLKFLNNKEKQKIVDKLNKQFGIKEIPGILSMRGKERLFLFQGDLDAKQIKELEKTIPIERIGVYFAKTIAEEIKLSIEGIHLLKNQITKNIYEINTKQMQQWMMGRELDVQSGKKGFVIMKHDDDFLGSGKASEKKITNFIPKNRRLKEKN